MFLFESCWCSGAVALPAKSEVCLPVLKLYSYERSEYHTTVTRNQRGKMTGRNCLNHLIIVLKPKVIGIPS